ncbi:tetratricopeptide repeat protein [Rickettsia hoogstraalii]|nr:tetratricopeptide repeat protein [Rickettsia hoogstraalii]MCX4084684.1 tetratricopeptide repeat protein [Rickettsia hoogstraalii]
MAYQNLGDISKGLKYLEKALKIFRVVCQRNHSNIASSIVNVSLAYEKLGDTNKSHRTL